MHLIFLLKNGISNFIADTTARYNLYVARENKKLQLQRAAHEQALAMQAMQADYDCTGDILREAINHTASVTALVAIQNKSQMVTSNWLTKSPRGYWVMNYRAIRNPSNVTAMDVQRVLQREMTQLCNYYGYPQKVLRVKYQSDFRVLIQVVDAADVRKPVQI